MKAKDYLLKFVSRRLGVTATCVAAIISLPEPHWLVVVAKIVALAAVAIVFIYWQGRIDERQTNAST